MKHFHIPDFFGTGEVYLVELLDDGHFKCSCAEFTKHPDSDCDHIATIKNQEFPSDMQND